MKIKNITPIALFLLVTLLFGLSSALAADNDIVMVNALQYHKSMLGALKHQDLLKIPLGREITSVGGSEQDPEVYTEGVPFAFRFDDKGNVWVLDSANKALKQFGADGKLKNSISLGNMGQIVRDFAFADENGFWLLSPIEGYVLRIDSSGKILSKIEGFQDARAIETAFGNGLLVDMPMLGSVLRFGSDETLQEQYAYDQGLSLFEGIGNRLLGLAMEEKNVKLLMRTVASPAQTITLEEFPLDIEDEKVVYAGAEILGKDASGSIYLNLIACHEQGPIYRDRIYRCNSVGKVVDYTDILIMPCLTPDLPRSKVVTPDGKVVYFYLDKENYVLAGYSFPD